jgi:DEAD/DEAH box helicase domain-containing protein
VMAALPFSPDDRRDGVFGLAFAMRHIAALLLMCDAHDLGLSINAGERSQDGRGEPRMPIAAESDTPRIFIYDTFPGGIGFSEPLFGMHADLLTRTRELIAGCDCESGCPSCVGPIGETGPLAKTVALRILDRLLYGQFRDVTAPKAVVAAQDEVPF